ncbi:MAG TPA: hypothetical protein VK191_05865 [Symbiobacteriaceae bacterium]|nr:hypothetical protein [Symbiobacteriaceae bacterium]
MQIQVDSVQIKGREMRVRFTCEWGAGEARWVGPTPKPESKHDVEIDVAKELKWGTAIRLTLESQPLIATTIDGNRIIAQLEAVELDGTAAIRLGSSLILVDAVGEPLAPGSWVQVRTPDLVLYPFTL